MNDQPGSPACMRALAVAMLILGPASVQAEAVPEEVLGFVSERRICEHFLGEPVEGGTPEQRERRDFVADSIDIHCAGMDKRLAALKRRYDANESVMQLLGRFETKIE